MKPKEPSWFWNTEHLASTWEFHRQDTFSLQRLLSPIINEMYKVLARNYGLLQAKEAIDTIHSQFTVSRKDLRNKLPPSTIPDFERASKKSLFTNNKSICLNICLFNSEEGYL